eukprot:141646_1
MRNKIIVCLIIVVELISKATSYSEIVNELKNYIETNKTFAIQVNETFIEAGYGPNSSNPITYDDMYKFWDFWITNAPMYNSSFLDTVSHFATTTTGNMIFKTQKAAQWAAEWQHERKEYCNSYNSTWVIPIWEQWNEINMTQYII